MTINEAMLRVAEDIARAYGYIEAQEPWKLYAKRDWFWGNQFAAKESPDLHITTCKYIRPAFEDEPTLRIDIDMSFGKPRLNVQIPGASAHVMYRDGHLCEAQAFLEKGPLLVLEIQNYIDEYLKK